VHFMCALMCEFYVCGKCVRKMCIWMCVINVCLETEFQTHQDLFGSITWRTAVFPVPPDVQKLMSTPTSALTFKFLDPVQCLIRLLTVGPLSGCMDNMAFTPTIDGVW
jgi:hypothetical protein